jgi:polysaccharide export outer membrane protein
MQKLWPKAAPSDSRAFIRVLVSVAASGLLVGCSTPQIDLPAAGPSARRVLGPAAPIDTQLAIAARGIQLIVVTDALARRLAARIPRESFAEAFGSSVSSGLRLGVGDVVEVTIWEAPPALLFSNAPVSSDSKGIASGVRANALPDQPISPDGTINVPFVGAVRAAGRTVEEIESDIKARLAGKAHRPQVMVRVLRNVTSTVTVVGEVATSLRMPLSPGLERLLDALATAGGVRQPVGRVSLQLTRGAVVRAMPLESIIRDPAQNIVLRPGDVITALHQPSSLTVFGATGRNEELNFEVQGITLTQALARAGGLQDQRADAQGVFVFRFEEPSALEGLIATAVTPEGKVPVIYQLDLRDPASFFAAQSFPVQHRDLLYVSNAPAAELQKFLNIVTAIAAPVLGVINVTR